MRGTDHFIEPPLTLSPKQKPPANRVVESDESVGSVYFFLVFALVFTASFLRLR